MITVTHHLDNVDQADKLLILGHGELVWFGSRVEALSHFDVAVHLTRVLSVFTASSSLFLEREVQKMLRLILAELLAGGRVPRLAAEDAEAQRSDTNHNP